jgi:filamentous hemagglutinin family protein
MPKKGVVAAAVALALGLRAVAAEAQSLPSNALPTGGNVVGGQASISQSGAAMRIDQASARAAIDWQSFNIGAQASVTFSQPSASAIALNRVLGASGSEILGRLSANGQVFLVNPNGILFGRGAQVDVGGLLASTLAMSPEDFMAGRYVLRGQGSPGSVANQGTIRAPRGSVSLIAPSITNDGLIEAQHGAVSLAAANAATVDFMADGLLRIRVDEGALKAGIANHGVLRADGGTVTLTAKALDSLASAVLNNTGIIEARTVENANGVVRLSGADVYVSGTIDVSAAQGSGGAVQVLGERVALLGGARVDASGAHGGGQVLVGGDFQGGNAEIPNAKRTYVGPDAVVDASATQSGDGGKVIVWSDERTGFYGTINARGGVSGGDGGFVETSSKGALDVRDAMVDTTAAMGSTGHWLLDPKFIVVATGGSVASLLDVDQFFDNSGGTSFIDPLVINAALTDVTLQASTDVTFQNPVSMVNAGVKLTAQAGRSILINADIRTNNADLRLIANDPAADPMFRDAGTGSITIGASINVGSGKIDAGGQTLNIIGAPVLTSNNAGVGFKAGTLNIDANDNLVLNAHSNVDILNLSSGILGGTGNVAVKNAFNWTNGIVTGPGAFTTGGVSTLSGANSHQLNGRAWTNSGTALLAAGSLLLNDGAALNNASGGTFEVTTSSAAPIDSNAAGTNTLHNAGTFNWSSPSPGSVARLSAFNNTGQLNVRSGTLNMSSPFTQTGNLEVGATFVKSGGFVNAGMLYGTGTVNVGTATVTNNGTVAPGGVGSVGTLTIIGGFAQGASGVVSIDLGSQDVLAVSASMSLAGTLNVSHSQGFKPSAGSVFTPITYASASGDFAAKTFPSKANYGTQVAATSYNLTFNGSSQGPNATTTVSAQTGFEPATVATAGMTGAAAPIASDPSSTSSLVALAVRPHFVLPDVSDLIAAMSELRRKKDHALETAERILERDPAAADLPPCAGVISGHCIAERPARPAAREGEGRAKPELAHLWGIERKIALLIGVAEYRHPIPRLDSPLKDIAEIGRLYREQFGYEVRTLANADKASMVLEINRLIQETDTNDSVVVLYAGHGHVVEKTGRGYWIPGGAGGDEPTQWISNSDIAKMLANIPARQVLLVSDSCYSGTLTREGKIERSEVLSDPRAVLERRSVTVLSSGGEEPVADAGKDGHSVFAWHFIRTLGRVAQWSSGVDVYERLAEAVQLDFPQHPQYGAALGAGHQPGADFLFEVRRY